MNDERIVIGYVKGPRGVRGEIRVSSATDIPERFRAGEILYIENHERKVMSSRLIHKEVLLFLEGIIDRDQVLDLSGSEITADIYGSELLPPSTYFHYDLIGLEVQSGSGARLGHISEIIETGANDVYVVYMEGEKDILIPAISSVVTDVNIDQHLMVIDMPAGLDTRK